MSQITTHILDTATGRPAVGVRVSLQDGNGSEIASGLTDEDGRVARLGPDGLARGSYRLSFAVGDYFARSGRETFYSIVSVDFLVADAERHYHVPLLVSPFAYSTYRGS